MQKVNVEWWVKIRNAERQRSNVFCRLRFVSPFMLQPWTLSVMNGDNHQRLLSTISTTVSICVRLREVIEVTVPATHKVNEDSVQSVIVASH